MTLKKLVFMVCTALLTFMMVACEATTTETEKPNDSEAAVDDSTDTEEANLETELETDLEAEAEADLETELETEQASEDVVDPEPEMDEEGKDVTESTEDLDELTQAFLDYMDFIGQLAPEENRLISMYDSVTGENYVNDELLYNALVEEIIPDYRLFSDELESYMARQSDIRELHEQYIKAVNIQYSAFTLMVAGIENQDYETITEANLNLDEARSILRNWIYEVEDIAELTGVNIY
ncbi:hypothetical protein [Bacillus suaedae]|uniref:Uncharacterized protein n=1 Tax=Halalkalibacter suaedae TaxID=2822140 RepID=A0A940WWQ6_9BACI|nr:hypothetical protein [Bacillus suaedae]MBP3951937.1 hypothetical protein [Bacillus suaedae]